ncbi:MAG: DUF3822 family protein [Flavobacteriales bacterium]|nr:DUF3822 family protein [Flavobacteriales bacterium]
MTTTAELEQLGEAERFAMLHAAQCHLALHIGAQRIEWCVSDPGRGELIVARQLVRPHDQDMAAFVSEQLSQHKLLSCVFRKTTISVTGSGFCLVPRAFFREQDAASLLAFTTGSPSDHVLHHHAWQGDVVVTGGISDTWYRLLTRICPAGRITHEAAILIEAAYRLNHRKQPQLLIWSGESEIVLIASSQQLLLCNRYEVAKPEDALFYIANAATRLGFDLEHVPVLLAGEPVFSSEIRSLLTHYSAHANYLNAGALMPARTTTDDRPATLAEIQVVCAL